MSNCKHGVDRDLECGACEDEYEATRAHKAAMALVLDRRAIQHTLVNKTRARMKIKVSEATGVQLDWLVAKCEGKNGILHDDGITRCIVIAAASGVYKGTFKPTINWALGGPIIERESICLEERKRMGVWLAYTRCLQTSESNLMNYGSTPLIAVMRCFVTSKLGNEVEVPNELV